MPYCRGFTTDWYWYDNERTYDCTFYDACDTCTPATSEYKCYKKNVTMGHETTPGVEHETHWGSGTTEAPEATTGSHKATTPGPEATTQLPEATTGSHEATTQGPESTTGSPETTTQLPKPTTGSHEATTQGPEETTQGPKATTEGPGAAKGPGTTIKGPEGSTEVHGENSKKGEENSGEPGAATNWPMTSSDKSGVTLSGADGNTMSSHSHTVTVEPTLVITRSYSEHKPVKKTPRCPKDVPLIKQITG